MIPEWAVRRIINSLRVGIPLDTEMLLIYQDLIKEANQELFSIEQVTPEKIAIVFEKKAQVWERISELLPDHGIHKQGFRLVLRKSAPKLYKTITAYSFKDIPQEEDPEFIPSAKRRHKKRRNQDDHDSGKSGEIPIDSAISNKG